AGSYTVTASDLAAETLVNIATVNATDPEDTPLPEVTATLTIALGEPVPVPTLGPWGLWLISLLLLLVGISATRGRIRPLNRAM
ncbi:MAG: IPTL-CTERM sorting domain-containing protein, partial [Wenzhouxiangella sp.]